MKNSYLFYFILILLIGGIIFYFYNSKTTSNNNSYNSTKISSVSNELENKTFDTQNQNISEENASQNTNEQTNSSEENTSQDTNNQTNSSEENPQTQETETQISDFTTKIYTKEEDRQNNINITCSTLNDTVVNPGDTFSFCNTVGKATTSKGYEKADVFKDGEVIQALGGGNCQVSTTLYNAVIKVQGLDVTERHSHSNNVPYIEDGMDAAVATGSYDFKFVNNTGNKIKISSSCDNDFVYIKLFKIE